jgi:hypothetical protein
MGRLILPRHCGKVVGVRAVNLYDIVIRDRKGRIVSQQRVKNLLTTAGANILLDSTIKTGVSSPTWYVGLIKGSTPTFATADTMASHAGWTEIGSSDVSESNRQAFTPGSISAGAVDNSGSPAVYHMLTSITLQGLFLANNNTLAGSTGTLYGEASFTASAVQNGYTVSVTATLSITAG